eukprot:TRINITY_DN3403_c0_g1_i1.p1 TRINITY_DN3403_c0_g1~~TRINITY_DN3403_c0_g1_i1.p1  ORF type:complete len:138 (-),score=12.45 TRINITY_DN3403_c0_g1_i1:168-581(-)
MGACAHKLTWTKSTIIVVVAVRQRHHNVMPSLILPTFQESFHGLGQCDRWLTPSLIYKTSVVLNNATNRSFSSFSLEVAADVPFCDVACFISSKAFSALARATFSSSRSSSILIRSAFSSACIFSSKARSLLSLIHI